MSSTPFSVNKTGSASKLLQRGSLRLCDLARARAHALEIRVVGGPDDDSAAVSGQFQIGFSVDSQQIEHRPINDQTQTVSHGRQLLDQRHNEPPRVKALY